MKLKNLEWELVPLETTQGVLKYVSFMGDTLGTFTIKCENGTIDARTDKVNELQWHLFHNEEKISVEYDPMAAGRYAEEYLRNILLELVLEDE